MKNADVTNFKASRKNPNYCAICNVARLGHGAKGQCPKSLIEADGNSLSPRRTPLRPLNSRPLRWTVYNIYPPRDGDIGEFLHSVNDFGHTVRKYRILRAQDGELSLEPVKEL